jgi:hypothetical protein
VHVYFTDSPGLGSRLDLAYIHPADPPWFTVNDMNGEAKATTIAIDWETPDHTRLPRFAGDTNQ